MQTPWKNVHREKGRELSQENPTLKQEGGPAKEIRIPQKSELPKREDSSKQNEQC